MSAAEDDDELKPEETEGYKKPKEASLNDMMNKDQNDESLQKWKASLVKDSGAPAAGGDDRRVVVLALALEFDGRDDVVIELDTPEKVKKSSERVITIKEGTEYRIKVTFRVQRDIVTGLKYLHVVKRKGITVDKTDLMIGSYAPAAEPHVRTFPSEQAPSGMMARGQYNVKSRFMDDDGKSHLEWSWSFAIKKDWNSAE